MLPRKQTVAGIKNTELHNNIMGVSLGRQDIDMLPCHRMAKRQKLRFGQPIMKSMVHETHKRCNCSQLRTDRNIYACSTEHPERTTARCCVPFGSSSRPSIMVDEIPATCVLSVLEWQEGLR